MPQPPTTYWIDEDAPSRGHDLKPSKWGIDIGAVGCPLTGARLETPRTGATKTTPGDAPSRGHDLKLHNVCQHFFVG